MSTIKINIPIGGGYIFVFRIVYGHLLGRSCYNKKLNEKEIEKRRERIKRRKKTD